MKLREIFIKGFKSFADPTRLEISEKVTVVVGPNGSGKSNVVDAIRWVLGEQSMKEIRAQEREDVVFWGNEKRPPAQTAYVELVFEDEGNRITVARELSRDGTSRYILNGDVVRLKDIKELLMQRGFGKNPYSIIGQGQIDKIVSASPESLRMMIEEIAGIGIYREKKKEALQKLDATQLNLARISDILFEVDKNRRSLYLKAKRAERYVEYSTELEELKKRYYGGVYRIENRRLNDIELYRQQINQDIKDKLKQLAQLEMNWSALKEEFNQIDEEMESYTKTLEEFKQRENQLLEVRETFIRRLNDLENRYIESSTKIDMLNDETNSLKNRFEEIKIILERISEELSTKENTLLSLEAEKQEIYKQYTEQEKEILKRKHEYEEMEKTIAKIHNEIVRLNENNQDIRHRIEMIQNQRQIKELRKSELEEEIADLEKHLLEIAEKENELVRELETIKLSLSEYSTAKEKKVAELENLSRNQKELSAEIEVIKKQIADYQGFSNSIRRIFENKDLFNGLVDVVANLVDFDNSLATAYETLLGGAAQHVVVENADTAKRIIEFLKAGEYGRATFIPLDLIETGFSPLNGLEKEKGFVGYAAELVKVPREYDGLRYYLFGNDIIVDNIDNAVEIKRKHQIRSRIVTLDGELISGRGAITGGRSREDYAGSVLSRRVRLKVLEEEFQKLEERRKDLELEIDVISKEIKNLQDSMNIVREELANVTGKSLSSKRVLEELQKSLREVTTELGDLLKLEAEYNAKLEGNLGRIHILEEQLNELEDKRKSLQVEVSTFSRELDERRKKLEQLNESIATYRAEVKSLSERKLQYTTESERIKNRLVEIADEITSSRNNLKRLEVEIDQVKQMLLENERELETIKRMSQEIFAGMRERKSGKEEKLQQLQELEERIRKTKEELEMLKERLHETDLRIQEINFKLSSIPDEYRNEIDVDYDELDRLQERIKELENKIKMLGPVDLNAMEEYKKVEEEYTELSKQKMDLEEAKKKLEKLIEETDNEAREQFMKTFNKINEAFRRYVENLFYGGTGSMRIMEEGDVLESGIEIVISKAGKRVQKLQLLSGGEKALVGIALIMSMLEAHSGVFYVLDEVDAPLDDYNSEKFRRLLEQENSQFIVITHNKLIMEAGDVVHGVTMVDGVSKVVQVKMEEVIA
ncbi:chromosome segregation protein SMC [Fervidobacterium thailandense]|uniref:Chromosome partition protein Smc n=1 Tax=Fervidobacterium thailandense TaxID=1008305 RepID=A0A1E3G578_9BACT|nr:chromosome segregation protein SMC [Fervidobacterium thailandense]ODN31404.1 chromosome segregation protein SMC [Fervidobacterium thailandense]